MDPRAFRNEYFKRERGCTSKVPYNTEGLARSFATLIGARAGKVFGVYRCSYCAKYHLTTKKVTS